MVAATLTIFLGGDVMTGRGVDQVLPRPGSPRLWEPYERDARAYVALAEARNGPVPRPVPFSWPWGDALQVVEAAAPAARVVNLETSITTCDRAAPGKAVHYRMSPGNVPCLTALGPDVCVMANNHVLDFGRQGLRETLDALAAAGLVPAGAGADRAEAWRPVAVPTAHGGRVMVAAVGAGSSGIPGSWEATAGTPGVALLADLSDATADEVARGACAGGRPGDVVVVSIHWGSNWGYDVTEDQVRFAHRLVDGGVDLVHGHSSHHPRPIEVYRGKLVLYGCGDLVDDYEGIGGYEELRDDLRLLYFASLDPATGRLADLSMTPMQSRRMRLRHASTADARWLCEVVRRASRPFATRVDLQPDGSLSVRPAVA